MRATEKSVIEWESRDFLDKLKSGDKEALRKLVIHFQNSVYNLAFKILWNKEDAEDVLQEAFLKIVDNISSFREQSSLSTWIYKIATNTALMKLRARRAREGKYTDLVDFDATEIAPTKLTPENHNPFNILLRNESRGILQQAIEQLPEIYRGAFVLKDMEQMPTKEIVEILGISTEALYSRLKRARTFLREAILTAYREKEELENAMP